MKRLMTLVTIAVMNSAYAASPALLTPETLDWKTLPADTRLQYAVMAGNPQQSGYFIARLKLPRGYQDISHTHVYDRFDTVISGSYYFGFGDKVNKSQAIKLAAGSFIAVPAQSKHYGFTEEGAVLQISGQGPWQALLQPASKPGEAPVTQR